MNEKELRAAVQRLVLCELARTGQRCVPVMSSNRHVHLCQADVEKLFGAGYQLTKMRDLVQPGQFACNERVTIETERARWRCAWWDLPARKRRSSCPSPTR